MNALDTHGLVKRLIAAGFAEPQAEAVMDVVRGSRESDLSNLATKSDIFELKAEIAELRLATKADLSMMESRFETRISVLETKIEASKNELLKGVIGLLLVQGGAVITLIKLLPGH